MRCLLAVSLILHMGLEASMEGGKAVAGDVAFQVVERGMEISASDRAIIEWNRFSIPTDHTVSFIQPGSQASVLNRVIGQDLSRIDGTLQANGRVYLINPQGVIFGENALIHTAAFFASTLPMSNEDFLLGHHFLEGESQASIIHLGTIHAKEGDIGLIAHQIKSSGHLKAPQGAVSLVTGHEVILKPTGCPVLNIKPNLKGMGIELDGIIEALDAYLQTDNLSSLAFSQKGEIQLSKENGKLWISSVAGIGVLDPESKISAAEVKVEAPKILHMGQIDAETIDLQAGQLFMETSLAKVTGKNIAITAPRLFSSATYSASKGTISISGDHVALAAAQMEAEGGSIRVEGNQIVLTPATSIVADGGGSIEILGVEKVENHAHLSAKGGGFIEVSSQEDLIQQGTMEAPLGKVVIDPKNITLSSTTGMYPSYPLIDPNEGSGSGFGNSVAVLNNGNVVVTKPNDDAGGSDAGAVYLYNGSTGALISTLIGAASDTVGSGGITTLALGNFVIRSPAWINSGQANAGAATWGSQTTGVSGIVSSANSLVGSNADDSAFSLIYTLSNGNYVVANSSWNDGRGAATWGDGTTGISGVISDSNSLVGTNSLENTGSVVMEVGNSNYVVGTPFWNGDRGAATWGDGTTGITGTVSVSNSLVGSNANDRVSSGSFLSLDITGNYLVFSPFWNSNIGAVTWADGSMATTGTVSVSNSLVGASSGDQTGSHGGIQLTNGNYVVPSVFWNSVRGAATWGDGSTGTVGTVSASNSLVGSTANDAVGGSVFALTNGNYVVTSSFWRNGAFVEAGAVTWGDGTTGITGTVSTSNSLVGGAANHYIGSDGITALTNGNYVVKSPNWASGADTNVGAATWCDGTGATTGTVSAANSLVGSTAGDLVTSGAVLALTNGNYVVSSPTWSNGAFIEAGAATWGDGTTGVSGTISSVNSLVGTANFDRVSYSPVGPGLYGLGNGNYVIRSVDWNEARGAVTWVDGTTGITGTITASNSLVGTDSGNNIGIAGVAVFSNHNFAILSNSWNAFRGAVTWADGSTGITGTVSASNSLIGENEFDGIGSGGAVELASGNYLIRSLGPGFITLADTASATTGTVSRLNSIEGSQPSVPLDNSTINDTFICPFPFEGSSGTVITGLLSPSFTYSSVSAQTMTLFPQFITDLLDAGTDVTLQANNDLTISSPLSYSNGTLNLEAGRSVVINADITTGGTDFVVSANETLASGVVDADRSSGDAVLTVGAGVTINGGGGDISLSLLDGTGKTFSESGDVTIGSGAILTTSGSGSISIMAEEHNIVFSGSSTATTANGDILFRAGVSLLGTSGNPSLTASGSGTITLVCDTLNPTSPSVGSGLIDLPSASFSSTEPVVFYANSQTNTTLPATINGASFSPGDNPDNEFGLTYYPDGTPVAPYTVFYKTVYEANPLPPPPPPPPPFPTNQIIEGRIEFQRATVESFDWFQYRHFGPYLSSDFYTPFWTDKGFNNSRLPSLVHD